MWRVQLHGIEQYKPDRPMIFIANHRSFLDMVAARAGGAGAGGGGGNLAAFHGI